MFLFNALLLYILISIDRSPVINTTTITPEDGGDYTCATLSPFAGIVEQNITIVVLGKSYHLAYVMCILFSFKGHIYTVEWFLSYSIFIGSS